MSADATSKRAAGSSVNFPRLLLEREHAGYDREAMKAVYPRNCWPEAWKDDDEEHLRQPDREEQQP